MTTLYKPVQIETTEQAEALPSSTRAIRPDGQAAARLDGVSEGGQWTSKLRLYAHDEVIGWTALVPVEAEEEVVVNTADLDLDPEVVYQSDDPDLIDAVRAATKRRRYVTPWEDA